MATVYDAMRRGLNKVIPVTRAMPSTVLPPAMKPAHPVRRLVSLIRSNIGMILWTAFICALSQLPYRHVWCGKFTFVYDAYTTFSPWNISRLKDLRAGDGLLKIFQENLPSDVWPSYFFSGLLRQMAALVQPNTASAHAIVQALHALLLVPAVGLLFRSFGVPFRYGIVGGLVYALSGIHVSLSQHVLSHEALLYLVLSLWGLRELVLLAQDSPRGRRLGWAAFVGLMLASLVRVHHEAVLYVVPITAWVIMHLWQVGARDGLRTLPGRIGTLAVVGVLVAISAVPMLITAFEMSITNKTLIHRYDDLGPYFPHVRALLLGLSLHNFTGGAFPAMPAPFSFGQEITLSYVFAGSLSTALLTMFVATLLKNGRRREAWTIIITTVLLLGYTFGVGSPIHRALCTIFPFLVPIAHNYYGLHLLYLVTAFGVAGGIHLLAQGRGWSLFTSLQVLVTVAVLYFMLRASAQGGPGVQGSMADFEMALQLDSRWLTLCTVAVIACAIGHWLLSRRVASRISPSMLGSVVLVALSGIVAVDLLKPAANAHFVPTQGWIAWERDPLGGFNPSKPVIEFFAGQPRRDGHAIRVLPIFPKPGGWQSNALLPQPVKLLHMPSDTGGNRVISARLDREPSTAAVRSLIGDFGVDAFWVSRWGMEPWAAVLAQSPDLALAKSAEYGGDVYFVDYTRVDTRQRASGNHWIVPWQDPAMTSEQGLVARHWNFPLNPPQGEAGQARMSVQLPLMWHAAYAVEQGGRRLKFTTDDLGRLLALDVDLKGGPLAVQYPSRPLSMLVVVAALAYLVLLGAWLGSMGHAALVHWRPREAPRAPSGANA